MDPIRFAEACARVVGVEYERASVGLLAEKTLHAVLKEYFAMVMLVEIDGIAVEFSKFAEEMASVGKENNVDIRVMHEDIFNTMHRI